MPKPYLDITDRDMAVAWFTWDTAMLTVSEAISKFPGNQIPKRGFRTTIFRSYTDKAKLRVRRRLSLVQSHGNIPPITDMSFVVASVADIMTFHRNMPEGEIREGLFYALLVLYSHVKNIPSERVPKVPTEEVFAWVKTLLEPVN